MNERFLYFPTFQIPGAVPEQPLHLGTAQEDVGHPAPGFRPGFFGQCVADSDSLRSRFGEGGIGVGLDPLCIGIPTSLLPGDDLPPDLLIDPEAGKHGSGFHFDRGCGLGLQYRGVEQACRADLFGSRYVAFQEGAVQRLLDLYAVRSEADESRDVLLLGKTGSDVGQYPGVMRQIQRILPQVEQELVGGQRTPGKLFDERMFDDFQVGRPSNIPGLPFRTLPTAALPAGSSRAGAW